MTDCPVCNVELLAVVYDDSFVLQCPTCNGHLLSTPGFNGFKRHVPRTEDDLKAEVASQFKGSTPQRLKCPHCHFLMRKERLTVPVLDVHADVCDRCSLVWLDGGELAMLQLAFKASGRYSDVDELKRRVRALEASPERKAAFEENLARLPDTDATSDGATTHAKGMLLHAVLRAILRILLRF